MKKTFPFHYFYEKQNGSYDLYIKSPDDMQRGEEGPLIPQPANESSGSLWFSRVQVWQQMLSEGEE